MRGARLRNLKSIDVNLPRNALVVYRNLRFWKVIACFRDAVFRITTLLARFARNYVLNVCDDPKPTHQETCLPVHAYFRVSGLPRKKLKSESLPVMLAGLEIVEVSQLTLTLLAGRLRDTSNATGGERPASGKGDRDAAIASNILARVEALTTFGIRAGARGQDGSRTLPYKGAAKGRLGMPLRVLATSEQFSSFHEGSIAPAFTGSVSRSSFIGI